MLAKPTIRLNRGETTIVTIQGLLLVPLILYYRKYETHLVQLTALVDHGGELEAQTLAKGRCCLNVDIMAAECCLDDFTLMGPCKKCQLSSARFTYTSPPKAYLKSSLWNCRRRVNPMSVHEFALCRGGMAERI